ncbi:MAG TPA: PPC domain-containing DNA-binding protein [Candidatus Bathyarchaeia archaeon]|jgi:predicted DNA-binding protein with PD1-like motif|nr:PPC domain-containing DNA-binding protein [Candidatus Bathyarchaeia archaeon]
MIYSQLGTDKYVLRLESGDDILKSLKEFAVKKRVGGSLIEGIGSLNKVRLGHYDFKTKLYKYETFEDDLEILNLSGNISNMNRQPLPHVHVTLGRRDFSVIGGHLDEGSVANMVEVGVWKFPGKLVKARDDAIGLNVLQLARRI